MRLLKSTAQAIGGMLVYALLVFLDWREKRRRG